MKTPSFRTKLWIYFASFAAVIFSLLWILQTVFLQNFYDGMMQRNIRNAAEMIAASVQNSDFFDVIDRLTVEDSLLVYITDSDGDVIYSSDAYKPYFRQMPRYLPGPNRNDFFRRSDSQNAQNDPYRYLPDNFEDFLKELNKSESDSVGYKLGDSYIYGKRITLGENLFDDDEDDDDDETENAVLYVAGTLSAVGAAASIIRVQLIWVTVLSLVLAFVIAWLIARRFATPIRQLNDQAKMLSEDRYEDHFQQGFCRELDELNESLSQSAEKLSEARSYQKELLANVSHDLRTPLTMIKGYAEMVRDISWEDEKQRTADTDVIIREADRMTALVNEILEYTRLQEQPGNLNFNDVDLSALTESVADRFEPLFRNEGGVIERNITPGCIIRGDAELLERAVFNLIDNAVRHAEGEDKRVRISVNNISGKTILEVRNNGRGIDPEELPHIWEKYYTSRQRNGKGVSGLGLAIVKQTAVLHGAEVSAESAVGEGTSFSITFGQGQPPANGN